MATFSVQSWPVNPREIGGFHAAMLGDDPIPCMKTLESSMDVVRKVTDPRVCRHTPKLTELFNKCLKIDDTISYNIPYFWRVQSTLAVSIVAVHLSTTIKLPQWVRMSPSHYLTITEKSR